jgi:hypothetical protein
MLIPLVFNSYNNKDCLILMSTIDSQTILTYPTYFARQGIQSINIDIVTTMDKGTRNKSNIFSKQTGHEDKSKDKRQ